METDTTEDRLGEEGEGFSIAEEWLGHARVPYAAANIGVAQASLDLAAQCSQQRKTLGSPCEVQRMVIARDMLSGRSKGQ